jgi:hypothetical protein
MCDNWKSDYSKKFNCKGVVLDSGEGEFIVKGKIDELGNSKILFWAPNPPTYTTSYSGSGLPYVNPSIAYENTPNRGSVMAKNGNFEFRVRYPNSYYMGLGTVCVEPCCHIKLCGNDKIHTVKLGNGIPFRMCSYPPTVKNTRARENPMFYIGREDMPVRSQEKILRDSGYPEENLTPANFWGLRPPHP